MPHGSGDRRTMPRKVLAGFCRSPRREHARPRSRVQLSRCRRGDLCLVDTLLSIEPNDILVVVFRSDLYCVASGSVGAAMGMDTAVQQMNSTGTADVIARPP